MDHPDVQFCKLADGKVSCRLDDEEFYLLPEKEEVELTHLEAMTNKLISKLDEQKEKDIEEAIDQEIGKRKAEKLTW